MKRLSIIMLVILCTGCSFHHRLPLYKDYQRIKVGFPVPTDIQENKEWGSILRPNANKVPGVGEYAYYHLASDGNVDAKLYEGGCLQSLWPLWQTERDRSEGELLLNLNPAVEYTDSDIRKEIEKKYIEVCGGYIHCKYKLTELLKLAMDKGGLANEKFHLRKFEIDKFFPEMESRVWRISRTSSGSYYLSLEHGQCITLLSSSLYLTVGSVLWILTTMLDRL